MLRNVLNKLDPILKITSNIKSMNIVIDNKTHIFYVYSDFELGIMEKQFIDYEFIDYKKWRRKFS